MPDAYSIVTEMPPEVVEAMARAKETRAAAPQSRAMLESYLGRVPFVDGARVLRSAADPARSRR